MSLPAGMRLGPYEFLSLLGAGGMGEVYKAHDTRLNRFVAIKVLRAERVADEERKRRFQQESRAASLLNHPNIVTLHDILFDDAREYLVMEFVSGKTLNALIPPTGMRVGDLLRIASQVADGLSAAHEAGIIHRDLKPSNIIESDSGLVKIVDFGIAKLTEQSELSEDDATRTLNTNWESVIGTAGYMSPEQAEGRRVDARSDIFSFGAVLYEMAAGCRAFAADSQAAVLNAVMNQEPKPLWEVSPGLPVELDRIIMRCLRKDPARRHQHMSDVKVLLDELREQSEFAKVAPMPASKRSRFNWRSLATAAAILTGTAAVGLWLAHDPEVQPSRMVPLTTLAGIENFASFSPDGNQVVFCWNGEKLENWDLYVKMIGTANALRLTTDVTPDALPAWSPDGRQIAFLKGGERPGVYLISSLGGPEQKVAELGNIVTEGVRASAPVWSPDGKLLIVAKPWNQPKTGPYDGALILFPLQGGEPRPFLVPESGRSYQFPAMAPDGRSLAFASCEDSGSGCTLFLASVNTDLQLQGPPRKISEVPAQIAGMAWNADGRSIVYSAGTSVNDYFLWRVYTAGGKPKRLDIALQGAMFPAIARQGNRLAFTRSAIEQDIWRLQLEGRSEPFLVSSMLDSNAQFSPDGRRIVFASQRGVDRVAIWLADANGGTLAQLTHGPGNYDGSPRWSPDGRWIAYDALGSDRRRTIKVVESSGGQPRQVTHGPWSSNVPSWSGDGKWIYFTADRTGRPEIWRVSFSGGAAEQITGGGGYVAHEAPDRKILYYTKSGSYSGVPLYSRPLAGKEEKKVLDQVAGRGFVVFEDGIYHLSLTGPRTAEIRFYDFATGRIRAIVSIPGPVGLGLSVSPDRRTFLFTELVAAGTDLMLVENFR